LRAQRNSPALYAAYMTRREAEKWPVVRFRTTELSLGPRTWLGGLVALAIVVLSVFGSGDVWSGVGIGVAGILGAILGSLFQPSPSPPDNSAVGASAVRGLVGITDDVENAQHLTSQLSSSAANKSSRIALGLVDLQERLGFVREKLYEAMAEWDAIAPGSLAEVDKLRGAGQRALALLARSDGGTDKEKTVDQQ
jgi:hypothetical protein